MLDILRSLYISLAAAALWAQIPALAQDEPVDFEQAVSRRAVHNLGETPAPGQSPAGEEDVSRILTERPPVPLTPGVSAARTKPRKPALPVEGTSVNNRRCRLEAEAGTSWLLVKFADGATPGDTQRRAMPCQYLQAMEDTLQADPSATFVVSGETFVYFGRAYILLEKVLVESPMRRAGAVAPAPIATSTPATASAPAADSAPGTSPTAASASRVASASAPVQTRPVGRADAIVSELLGPQRKPVLVAVDQPKAAPMPSVAPSFVRELPAEAATIVADRTVRIIQEQGTTWFLANFDSDNTLQEPPYRILPCQLLELAAKTPQSPEENVAKPSPQDVAPRTLHMPVVREKDVAVPPTTRYKVSGEILQYKGKKYFLMRKRLPDRDMGQF